MGVRTTYENLRGFVLHNGLCSHRGGLGFWPFLNSHRMCSLVMIDGLIVGDGLGFGPLEFSSIEFLMEMAYGFR